MLANLTDAVKQCQQKLEEQLRLCMLLKVASIYPDAMISLYDDETSRQDYYDIDSVFTVSSQVGDLLAQWKCKIKVEKLSYLV